MLVARRRSRWRMDTIAEDHVLQSTQAAGQGFRPGFAITTPSPPARQLRRQVIGFLQGEFGGRGVFFDHA